jgi:hypothetical protein
MYRRLIIAIIGFLLVFSMVAIAQQDSPSANTPKSMTGEIDVGYRATDTAGDAAQYERYRDLRDGVHSNIEFTLDPGTYFFSFNGTNAGYRDQYFDGTFKNKKIELFGFHNSTPLNYAYNTLTPWVESGEGYFSLSQAARTAVQNKVPGVLGIPVNYAQSQQKSIYRDLSQEYRLQQRRNDTGFRLKFNATDTFAIKFGFQTSHKTGHQPFGLAFAFNNANELPIPLDNRTNDLSAGFEWVTPQANFSAGIDRSTFSNEYNQIEWENPLRVTDFNNGKNPPDGPYDPSGYSNGNGPAIGRISQWPDNEFTTLYVKGQYRMPRRTNINAAVVISDMRQDDQLIPWTSNAVINQQVVWTAFPELAHLPRETAEARVRNDTALVILSSHPFKKFDFNVRWRHNNHSNMSTAFDAVEYVRFDAVPEETGGESFGHSIVRDTLDANITFQVFPQASLRFGYGYDNLNRTGRSHNDMRDNAARVSFDWLGNRRVTLRVGYEYVDRVGSGFSEQAVEDAAAQPGLRYYDEADRQRHRVNALVSLTPVDNLDITGAVAYINDAYGGPGLEFGLLDNENVSYTLAFNYAPIKKIAFGFSWGRNEYDAFQKARQANPEPDPSWNDPNRDWSLANNELVRDFTAYLDLLELIPRTEIRLGYTMNDSDNGFFFAGPRVDTLYNTIDANGFRTFEQLPNVTQKWDALSAEFKVHFTEHYGFAFGYRYEKQQIHDFATINLPWPAALESPRVDYLGGLTMGYGARPYRGQTATFRVFRSF